MSGLTGHSWRGTVPWTVVVLHLAGPRTRAWSVRDTLGNPGGHSGSDDDREQHCAEGRWWPEVAHGSQRSPGELRCAPPPAPHLDNHLLPTSPFGADRPEP